MGSSTHRVILWFCRGELHEERTLVLAQLSVETYSNGERNSCYVTQDCSSLWHLEQPLAQWVIEQVGLEPTLF